MALAELKRHAAEQRDTALATLEGKRILAIGCGGYIGSHLLDAVLERADIAVEGIRTHPRSSSSRLSPTSISGTTAPIP